MSTRSARTTGMGLAGALGANLWVLGLVVPLMFGGQIARGIPLVPIPPIFLIWGITRRSQPALLLGVPVATLAPLALPEMESARQSGLGFLLVLISLLAYVVAVLRALARAEVSDSAPESRALEDAPVPLRWARRQRIFRGLAAISVLLPALFIYSINLHPPTVALVAASFPGDAERAQALMTALAGLVCATVFGVWLVRPLAAHLDRDFEVRVRAEESRMVARRGRPRLQFYFAVGLALLMMALVMALHAGSGG